MTTLSTTIYFKLRTNKRAEDLAYFGWQCTPDSVIAQCVAVKRISD